jgi:phosphoribosylanthranilate isomerase
VVSTLEAFRADFVQAEPGPGLDAAHSRGVRVLPVLHDGEDTPEMTDSTAGEPSAVLLEAAGIGGRGIRPDWNRAARVARRLPLVLAGGLTPENVGDAIRRVGPAAVDVSSGVESSPGVKDPERIRAFLAAAHSHRTAGPAVAAEIRTVFERPPR